MFFSLGPQQIKNKGSVMVWDSDKIKSVLKDVLEAVPPRYGVLKEDMQTHLSIRLAEKFEVMGLVTREEFDVQTRVLARTRAKLDALEKLMREP